MRYKVATRFAIHDDVRFISHHDTMRLFERALSRAQLPVKFSEGFNPRPKLSLPLPRTVGLASDVELFIFELDQTIGPDEVLHKLAQQMPAGITLLESWLMPDARPPQAELVEYQLSLPDAMLADVSEKVARILASPTWLVCRDSAQKNKGQKSIDLRMYLHDAAINEQTLCWTVRVTNKGTVRPIEMLAAVGLNPEEWHHRVRRTAVQWSTPLPAEAPVSVTV